MTPVRQLSAQRMPASGGTAPARRQRIGIPAQVSELLIHRNVGEGNSYLSFPRSKGSVSCQSETHFSSSQPVQVSPRAVTRSANKPLAAVPSALVQQPSQAAALLRVRQSVLAQTCWHARQAPQTVTKARFRAALRRAKEAINYPAGPSACAGFFRSHKTQKDSPCSTRS